MQNFVLWPCELFQGRTIASSIRTTEFSSHLPHGQGHHHIHVSLNMASCVCHAFSSMDMTAEGMGILSNLSQLVCFDTQISSLVLS